MSIKKTEKGWLLDFYPVKGLQRVRKLFATKTEALQHQAKLINRVQSGESLKPKRDTRRLSDLIDLYETHHMPHLASKGRLGVLRLLCELSGNPYAAQLTPEWYSSLRQIRAEKVKPNTLNHDRAYLHSLFSELSNLGLWHLSNPIASVKKIRHDDSPVRFLSSDEIKLLRSHLAASKNRHVLLIADICLSTGARWSEAETLTQSQLTPGLISFWKTKSRKHRSVPIGQSLDDRIRSHKPVGFRLFAGSYAAFTNALLASGIHLPDGQRTHILRHTFASHLVQQGGNLLELQKILGHASIQMTLRYAHLAPDHLTSARSLNPLTIFGHFLGIEENQTQKKHLMGAVSD